MPATLATASAIMKEIYEGDVREQLNSETITLSRIEKTSAGVGNDVGGKYVTFPLKVKRNTGIGARNEMELLPTPGQQGTVAARIGLKYQYGGISLSGQAIRLVDENYNSFIDAVDLEVSGLKDDLAVDQNRQVYGTGRGDLAVVVSGVGGVDNNVVTVNNTQYFQEGMLVDLITLPTTVTIAGRTVLAINDAAKTVTLSGASMTLVAAQILVRAGNLNREITGLQAIVADTGILYNVDPTVVGLWKSKVNSNGGTPRAVSEGLFMRLANDISQAGGKTTAIFTTLGVFRQYGELLKQQRQFVNTTEFTGGYKGLAFTTPKGDIPIVADKDAPPGTAWFLNEKALKFYREGSGWEWMTYGDSNKWERIPGYDAYQAQMFQYAELGTDRRNTHGVIKDLIED